MGSPDHKGPITLLLLVVFSANTYSQLQTDCGIDIVIAIDTSCSITDEDKNTTREFIIDLARTINIGPGPTESQLGVLTYNDGIQHQFYLNDAKTNDEAIKLAENINTTPLGCRTHTHTALEVIRNDYFTAANGDRPNAANIGLVLTDGITIPPRFGKNTIAQAQLTKDAGIEMYVVALPSESKRDRDESEWRAIASDKVEDHFYNVESFTDLTSIITDLSVAVCEEKTTVQSNITTATTTEPMTTEPTTTEPTTVEPT
ncbi:unnamed protein product, partial [Owenia fusiformis]